MAKNGSTLTIIIGLLLIIVGILSRVLTGTSSITALIPAFFGLPILVLGWLSLAPNRTRWSMIAVGIIALLGIIGTYSVLGSLLQGNPLSAVTISRGSMFVLCIIQLISSIMAIMPRAKS